MRTLRRNGPPTSIEAQIETTVPIIEKAKSDPLLWTRSGPIHFGSSIWIDSSTPSPAALAGIALTGPPPNAGSGSWHTGTLWAVRRVRFGAKVALWCGGSCRPVDLRICITEYDRLGARRSTGPQCEEDDQVLARTFCPVVLWRRRCPHFWQLVDGRNRCDLDGLLREHGRALAQATAARCGLNYWAPLPSHGMPVGLGLYMWSRHLTETPVGIRYG